MDLGVRLADESIAAQAWKRCGSLARRVEFCVVRCRLELACGAVLVGGNHLTFTHKRFC